MRNPTKGEYLYINPDLITIKKEYTFSGKVYSYAELISTKFLITKESHHDITIDWFGEDWKWGKFGSWGEDWTKKFITESEYRRMNNLNIILNNLDY